MKNEEITKLINQPLPVGHLTKFSFITENKAEIEQWLSNLSLHNMAEISKQIRTTLIEIAHFNTDAASKLELVETLRPSVYNLINSLAKHYLNQSLVLDSKGISVATLVQQLRGYDFAIYNQIALELLQQGRGKKLGLGSLFSKLDQKPQIALHRAMSAMSGIIYETDLLYLPAFEGAWRKIHSLYQLADQHKLLDAKVEDLTQTKANEKLSIKHTYMRAVLVSIARTNSLRQQEIQKLYSYSELWCSLLADSRTPSPNDLFVVDLESDVEPVYITTDRKLSHQLLYINASKLLEHIKHIQQNDGELLDSSESQLFHTSLIDYIAKSIEEPLERTTSRHPFEGKLMASIGMLACHYHIAGKQQFSQVIKLKQLIREEEASEMLLDKMRHYEGDGDILFHQDEKTVNVDRELLKLNSVSIIDISPGGYRVNWEGESTQFLKTGEMICLREDDSKPWQLGIIRWVQQKPTQGADLGIEILASKATACGVQPARPEDGRLDFMRGILLPEVKSLNRAATLVTPNYQFKPGHRVRIRRGTADVVAKLGKEYLKTQSFHQYDFTVMPSSKKPTDQAL